MPAEGAGGGRGPGQPGRGGRTARYRGFRARGPLLPTLLVLALVVIAFLIFASFYTDWLWYKSIDYASVFTTRLQTQITMFFVFGLITGGAVVLNAWLAYRFRPPFRGLSTEQQSLERYRVSVEPYRKIIAATIGVVIGLMAGSSASSQWRSWLLFRNSVPFGTNDAQFHKDVSFYAFRLPFWRYLLGFGFAIILLSLLVSLAVHYLYGGIKIQTPGERLTVAARVHVSVLLGLFVLLKATAYWLDRFSLVLDQHRLGGSTGSSFTGASYTDVNAILPAKNILIGVALICAVLFFVNVWRRTWQLPALGLALLVFSAVVIGGIYPAAIQYFKVRPSEPIREGPYIQRNINATRQAYGVADVKLQTFTPNTDITTQAAKAADVVKPNVRLIDPVKIQASFTNKQQSRGYYNFADPLDIDRYNVENNELVSVVAVRELTPRRSMRASRTGRTCTPSIPTASDSLQRQAIRWLRTALRPSSSRTCPRSAASPSASRGCTSARTARSTPSSAPGPVQRPARSSTTRTTARLAARSIRPTAARAGWLSVRCSARRCSP